MLRQAVLAANDRALSLARALVRHLPAEWRVHLRRWLQYGIGARTSTVRAAQERSRFDAELKVHDLPPIYHYWSNTYLRPMLEPFGFANPGEFFVRYLNQAHARSDRRPARFISLGAGNCDQEIEWAAALVAAGVADFTLECLDSSPEMLARGREQAQRRGLERVVIPVAGDFNAWRAQGHYDAVVANQSLHHVQQLERLFDAVAGALTPAGSFIVSDIIGRNGHQRWPEALSIVQEFWTELPERYRNNVQLHRHERKFGNWNCAVEGFEGIRAQDILPLLLPRFGFELFIPYANVIDPFIDRSFGPHFDAAAAADRALIDRIHARDEAEILAGRITPTHMFAVLGTDRGMLPQCRAHLTPEFCRRK